MNIIAKQGKLLEEKADLLVFGVFSGVQNLSGLAKTADKALGGLLTSLLAEENFAGKPGELLAVHTHNKIPASRILIVGLGDKKTSETEEIRRSAGAVIKYANKIDATAIVYSLPGQDLESIQALTEGALLADYSYLVYKPQEAKRLNKRGLVTLSIVDEDAAAIKIAEKGIALGEVFVRATVYARDLVNEPAGRMTPMHLLEHAEKIVANDKSIKLKILDRVACEKLGMGAFLAVAKGSDEPPFFIHMSYAPKKAKRKIALVGKGITFDSGGLSLKPSEHMETMKCDMAGAAAVLGIFSVLSDLEIDCEVHGLIAACENMPSGKAMRPGDIVTAMNGKSIEIWNTDAEGRLTLADTLSYAVKKIKPNVIVDMATLTGACMAGLGTDIAGLFSNNDKVANRISQAAQVAGEPLWRLPLYEDYKYRVTGDHADLRNTGRGKYGGAITAGLFLKEFVDTTPWAHIDIAGPAYAENETLSYQPKGGTGFGVRTILNWLK